MDIGTGVMWVRYGAAILIIVGVLLVLLQAIASVWREARNEARRDRDRTWPDNESRRQ